MPAAAQAAYERLVASPEYKAEQASEDKKKARQRKAFQQTRDQTNTTKGYVPTSKDATTIVEFRDREIVERQNTSH